MARNVSVEQFTNALNKVKENAINCKCDKARLQIRHLDYLRFKEVISENKDFLEVELRDDLPYEITCYMLPIRKGEKYDKLQKLW